MKIFKFFVSLEVVLELSLKVTVEHNSRAPENIGKREGGL